MDKKGSSEKRALLSTPASSANQSVGKLSTSDPWFLTCTEKYAWLIPCGALATAGLALILGIEILIQALSVSDGDIRTIVFLVVAFLLYVAIVGWFVILSVVLVALIRVWLKSAKNLHEVRRKLEKN